jgi:hypothetical protein
LKSTLDVPEQCCGLSLPILTKRFGIVAQQSLPASSNLNNENGTAAPESVDVAEAVALMADLGEAAEDEADETASADGEEGDDASAGDGGEESETAEEAADDEAETSADEAEAPNSGAPRTRRAGMPFRPSCARC